MQILEVSGRVCVKSAEVSPQLVKDMLTVVPPGTYIAMYRGSNYPYSSINGVPEGLELVIESERVLLLKAQSKEPVLPVLPKQVAKLSRIKLPVLDRPCTMPAPESVHLSKPATKPELPSEIVPHNAYNASNTNRTVSGVLHKSIQYLQESCDVLPFRKAW
ncbi:hypothetical protein [Microcoleus phage My-WqHQDG]|nr:hypothetical protein [Microcoleus phage My-WqHQDG]